MEFELIFSQFFRISWVNEKQRTLERKKDEDAGKYENTLSDYWDLYFEKESRVRSSRRNFNRWQREEKLKWSADDYGIKNQQWSQVSVNLISRNDFEDYFALLESRSKKANGLEKLISILKSVSGW